MVKISEFQIKDVVNVSDGKRLGNIGDIEINLTTGKIDAVVISGSGRVLGLFWKRRRHCYSLEKYNKNWSGCNFGKI